MKKRMVTRIPQPGDKSIDVAMIQSALNEWGAEPKILVDDLFGPKTRKALAKFQKSVGLSGSGVPGVKTMAALNIEVHIPPQIPVKYSGPITREIIADKIIATIQRHVDARLKETTGYNRSPVIDIFNRRVGTYLGAPYCTSAAWCAIDDACIALELKNPVPPTASSQAFRKTSFVPSKYIRELGELGKRGDACVLQSVGDPQKGHFAILKLDQISGQDSFHTLEYNTDGSGSRDGDGAYQMVRDTVDRSKKNAGKIFVCFVDIPQWILDANEAKVSLDDSKKVS